MTRKVKWLSYSITALMGVFMGLAIVGNVDFQAFGDGQESPDSIQGAVSILINDQLTQQISDQLQTDDPCLVTVVAAPKNVGITYNYLDLTIAKEIHSPEAIRAVNITANDYQLTLNYSNEGSCANRPNSEKMSVTKNFVFGQTYLFNATTNILLDTGASSRNIGVEQEAYNRMKTAKVAGSGTFDKISTGNNANFDITKCCELPVTVPGDGPDPEGGNNVEY